MMQNLNIINFSTRICSNKSDWLTRLNQPDSDLVSLFFAMESYMRIRSTDSFRLRDNVQVAIKPSSPARIDRPRAQHFHCESMRRMRGGKGRVGLLREESRGRTTTRVRHTRLAKGSTRERGSGCITTTQEPYLSLWHFQMSRGLSGVPPVETLRYLRTNPPTRPWEGTRAHASRRRHH